MEGLANIIRTMESSAAAHRFQIGDLLVGGTVQAPIGIKTDRHAITIASSRSGKGVGCIINNLYLWPHNALVVDPKGEAARETAWFRKAKYGHHVHVLDPFNEVDIPADLRARYNPLDALDPASPTLKEDIETIADGTVMRADSAASHWDDGAAALIAGLIADVLTSEDAARRNLLEVRDILLSNDRLKEAYKRLKANDSSTALGRLCLAGARVFEAEESKYFFSNADKNTRWLDSDGMRHILSASTFSLRDLKEGQATVYLCLPARRLAQHGRFLRLFVRCGIDAMATPMPDGSEKGASCLFMLDEFYALGYIDEISKSVGLMGSYGLHLWPFLQDLEQLLELYGQNGAGKFFANADLQQFFAVMDERTGGIISRNIGNYTVDDLPPEPLLEPMLNADKELVQWKHQYDEYYRKLDAEKSKKLGFFDDEIGHQRNIHDLQSSISDTGGLIKDRFERIKSNYNTSLQQFNTDASRVLGKPRLTFEQIAHVTRKPAPDEIAIGQISFVHGLKPVYARLLPYWELGIGRGVDAPTDQKSTGQ